MKFMEKSLVGIALIASGISSVNADDLAGLVLCNQLNQNVIISCNGAQGIPIPPNICLPVTWKEIATIPQLFGGTPESPVTHLVCEWAGIGSTVMDITDDHAGNFPTGKVSQIVINPGYTYDSIPSPIPDDYVASIVVTLKNK